MATFFNQTVRNINTAEVTAITSSSDSTIVLSILVANTNGSSSSDVSVRRFFGATDEGYLAFTVPVPADSNFEVVSNKYILPSGRSLKIASSISGSLDAHISYVVV